MLITAERLADDQPGTWQSVTFTNWAMGGLTYAPLRIQKHGPRARLDGHAQPGATFTGTQAAFTVPTGLRPLYAQYRTVPRITSGTPTLIGVAIGTDGIVTVYSSTSIGVTDRFSFTGIEWPLD